MGKEIAGLDEFFMEEAIEEAEKALKEGEVPVGAVVVYNGEIIGRGYNLKESKKDPTLHAEIIAIRNAAQKLGDWRLYNCSLYVTLEPCVMCFGAILNSRIGKLIYGAENIEEGYSKFMLSTEFYKKWNKVEVISGVKKERCELLIKKFFEKLRSSRL